MSPFLAPNGLADLLSDVRYWTNSGKHLLSLSFSALDPKRTSADRLATCDFSPIRPFLKDGLAR